MTPKQEVNVFSVLSALAALIFLMTPYGGSFPFARSAVGGIVVGLLIRGWFALSMKGAKAVDARVKHDQDLQFRLWFVLILIAGLGGIEMGLSFHWIFYFAGGAALLIGLPFMIWYRNWRKKQ